MIYTLTLLLEFCEFSRISRRTLFFKEDPHTTTSGNKKVIKSLSISGTL